MDRRRVLDLSVDARGARRLGLRAGGDRHRAQDERGRSQSHGDLSHGILLCDVWKFEREQLCYGAATARERDPCRSTVCESVRSKRLIR